MGGADDPAGQVGDNEANEADAARGRDQYADAQRHEYQQPGAQFFGADTQGQGGFVADGKDIDAAPKDGQYCEG